MLCKYAIRGENGERANSCVCNSSPPSIPMLLPFVRHFAPPRIPSARITYSRPRFPTVFQEDAGTDRPASSSATNFMTACTSATAGTATYFIKMDTAAPVSVWLRFDLYPALQFAFMAGNIFDFPNKILRRAMHAGETFWCYATVLFPKRRCSCLPLLLNLSLDSRRVLFQEYPSSAGCYYLWTAGNIFLITPLQFH